MILEVLLTVLIVFLGITFFGYFVHKALHQKWVGRFFVSHMAHHQKLYPPTDFYSETYRDPKKDNTAKFFFIMGLPLIILPIILFACHILSLTVFITTMISLAVFGGLNDFLHDAFHITNHWLRRFKWFQKLTNLHYIHHLGDMQANFGIYWFGWDKIFRTFKK